MSFTSLYFVSFLDDGPLLNAMFVGSYSIYVFLLLLSRWRQIEKATMANIYFLSDLLTGLCKEIYLKH